MPNTAQSYLMNCNLDLLPREIGRDSNLRADVKEFMYKVNSNATFKYDVNLVESFNDSDLDKLIRALTIIDKKCWSDKSVSAVPNLLRILEKREYSGYEDLLDWVFRTNDGHNPWLPTGNSRYGSCKNLQEFKEKIISDRNSKRNGETDALN
jgi:hypothetical protein